VAENHASFTGFVVNDADVFVSPAALEQCLDLSLLAETHLEQQDATRPQERERVSDDTLVNAYAVRACSKSFARLELEERRALAL
jgi:hypothetical protein